MRFAIIFVIALLLIPVFSVSNMDIEYNGSIVKNQNNPNNDFIVSRSSRGTNTDGYEPNDNFSTATIIVYNETGTTFINNQSVGGVGDVVDYWKLSIDNGTTVYSGNSILGKDDPIKVFITLSFNELNQGSNGVKMIIYDAEYHILGESLVAIENNPASLLFIGQVEPYIYIKVCSNPSANAYRYVLAIGNTTEDFNPAYDDNDYFANAKEINITAGKILQNQYLDITHDIADFYKFYVIKGQKIDIKLQVLNNDKDNFDLYLFNKTRAGAWIRSSTKIGYNDQIVYNSPINTTFYLRVVAKNGQGFYNIAFHGNAPPKWNLSFPHNFSFDEDAKGKYIELRDAFYDLNPNDQIKIDLWDEKNRTWINLTKGIRLDEGIISLLGNQTLVFSPLPNQHGRDEIKVRAYDDLEENYTEQLITIIVLPKNDPPILNGTKEWILGPSLTPSNDGNKISGIEGTMFACTVTAYDPYDRGDSIKFYDNTDLFNINEDTGEISFLALCNNTGKHKVEITAVDDGIPPMSCTREFEFNIFGCNCNVPEVELIEPRQNSMIFTLTPRFTWKQVNEDFFDRNVTYDLYLSSDEALVANMDRSTLNKILYDQTVFELPESSELIDNTTYYWSVFPNDGLHLGECLSGVYSFKTDTCIKIPMVKYTSPMNNKTISHDYVILQWETDYLGTDKIYYDVYFGVSMAELLDPYNEPVTMVIVNWYTIQNLYFENFYYWKVVPYTDKVRATDIEIWSFFVTRDIITIQQLTPANNSIFLPVNNITLTWDLFYSKPEKVNCILYWSTSPEFDLGKGIHVSNNRSYTIEQLSERTYYWKLSPYNNGLRGNDSETWRVTFKQIEIPKTLLIKPINTSLYSGIVDLQWRVLYSDEKAKAKMKYDIYMDNSTNDPNNMKLVQSNCRGTFYTAFLPFEENTTYYWYVIPKFEMEDGGIITGICSSGVVRFTLTIDCTPIYKIDLELAKNSSTLKPNSNETIYFILNNLGNRNTILDISIKFDQNSNITTFLEYNTIALNPKEKQRIGVNVNALDKAKPGDYTLLIKVNSRESEEIKLEEEILVKIKDDNDTKILDTKNDNSDASIISIPFIIIMIIVIIITIIYLYVNIKTKKYD